MNTGGLPPRYEATGGRDGGTLEGRPVVTLATTGVKTGKIRKPPLNRRNRGRDPPQTKALWPVMERPTMRVFISRVPS